VTSRRHARGRSTRWPLTGRLGTALIAWSLLLPSGGIAPAQETTSTSTSTLDVSVIPAGGELTIVSDDEPGSLETLGAVPAPSAIAAPMPAALPVTVSASIRLPEAVDVDPATGLSSTFITVNDDRGTGAGWSVILGTSDHGHVWNPVLEGNDPATITRLVPAPELGPLPYDAVSVGGTVSGLSHPMTVLQAGEGQGSGMFVQSLAIEWPLPGEGPGLVSIQLPSAP
jgi:hypothetical protein